MSDQDLGQEDGQLEGGALEGKQELDPQPKTRQEIDEETARLGGWKPEDEYTGKPEDWRSAEVFNERGVWIEKHKAQEKRQNDMEQRFNTRMDNANKLHEVQIKSQKEELVRKRDEAIDLADRETANSYQNSIDELSSQPEAAAPANNGQQVLDDWSGKNAWFYEGGPKAAYAQAQFNTYAARGMDNQSAIESMERDITREFPAVNSKREAAPATEGGSKPGAKRTSAKLGMGDLTSDELKYYRAMPNAWANDAEFLQAVQDTRAQK